MNINPREYFPLVTARESYLRQLDYFEVKHPHYDTLHREFRFLIDDLFKIMKDNNIYRGIHWSVKSSPSSVNL